MESESALNTSVSFNDSSEEQVREKSLPVPEKRTSKKKNSDAPLIKKPSQDSNIYETFDEYPFGVEQGKTSLLSVFLGIACFPLTLCGSWFTVQENEEVVTLNYGKYTGVLREPGVHCVNCWGRENITISKAKITTELPNTKVIDLNGNPVMVSGVVVYHYRDTRRAALDIMYKETFVKDIATAVMKQIVSQYPYEITDVNSDDDESDEETPCLKRDTNVISEALVKALQRQVSIAGVQVDSFRFNEISYASEIAAGMLKKQQAQSVVNARSTLVEGAVKIASGVMQRMQKKGMELAPNEKARLVSNLLVVVCADEHVQPMLGLGST